MVQICNHCHYEFEAVIPVTQCPDCGKTDCIRPATAEETEAFHQRKLEDVWDTAAG